MCIPPLPSFSRHNYCPKFGINYSHACFYIIISMYKSTNGISHSFKPYINGTSDRNSLLPTQYLFISRPTSIFTFLLCRTSSLFWAAMHPAKGLHFPPSLAAREAASEMKVKVIGQCFWNDPLKRLSCQVYPCSSCPFPPSSLEYE